MKTLDSPVHYSHPRVIPTDITHAMQTGRRPNRPECPRSTQCDQQDQETTLATMRRLLVERANWQPMR
jgi:hypothetical protein